MIYFLKIVIWVVLLWLCLDGLAIVTFLDEISKLTNAGPSFKMTLTKIGLISATLALLFFNPFTGW